ncbi:hypothetical protein [Streptosporangium sp. NPDC001681]|uniref:hypothetical protein n=1 Tax=Streptosporangium sp. NPDC001681 TaxID=3154395 RepID=UPI00332AA319
MTTAPKFVIPLRIPGVNNTRRKFVVIDDNSDLTCYCGNTPSYSGFREVTPDGVWTDPDEDWMGHYECSALSCGAKIDSWAAVSTEPIAFANQLLTGLRIVAHSTSTGAQPAYAEIHTHLKNALAALLGAQSMEPTEADVAIDYALSTGLPIEQAVFNAGGHL